MANIRKSIAKRLVNLAQHICPSAVADLVSSLVDNGVVARPAPAAMHGDYGLTFPAAARFLTAEARTARQMFQSRTIIDTASFAEAARHATAGMTRLPFGPQDDYLRTHAARFQELDNIAAIILQSQASRVPGILDVGMSINTLILEQLFPQATICALDRPDVAVAPADRLRLIGVDLTDPGLDDVDLGARFDLILFGEVLEHLLADPVRILRFFIRNLETDGRLVVTTPNFFARHRLREMAARINPQPLFSPDLTRETANAHHVREYAMSELLDLAVTAGGWPAAFFYSPCWDEDPQAMPEEEWLNMCVIISRGPSPEAGK